MNTHVFGGAGKTTLLIANALEDIEDNRNVLFVDPNGNATDTILSLLPRRRIGDVLIIDPTDIEYPVGFNVFYNVANKPLMAAVLSNTVKALWKYDDMPTPVMDRMLYNTFAALLNYPQATLLSVDPMLTDKDYREGVLRYVSDVVLKRKWGYWGTKGKKDWDILISSTENKAGEFSEDPRIRNVIGQPKSTFDLKRMLFDQKIVLLKLPQGELGGKASMFGSLFLAYLQSVIYSRTVHMPVNLYIDDVHLFDTPVVRQLLSNGKKYGVSVTVSNQYLAQLSRELRSSIIGNTERRIMFKTGIEDSEYLHKTIPHDITKPKLHELDPFEAMLFEGKNTNRIETFHTEPLPKGSRRVAKRVVTQSRRRYGSRRQIVEAQIERLLGE